MKTITPAVAAIIALRLLQYKHARRGLDLSPEIVSDKVRKLERELGYDAEFIREFFFKWIVPSVIAACHKGAKVDIKDPNKEEITDAEARLAILLMATEQFPPIPDIAEQVEKTSKNTDITKSEVNSFYWQYMLPRQVLSQYGAKEADGILNLVKEGISLAIASV
jgi:hypothetical protein